MVVGALRTLAMGLATDFLLVVHDFFLCFLGGVDCYGGGGGGL